MIKTVYFDLGNVLIFFSLPKLFCQLSDCTGLTAGEIETFFFNTDLRERYEKGNLKTEELFQKFAEKAKRPFTLAQFTHAFSDIFTPNTEIWPLVKQLKEKGIRLVLLSNTSECHFNYATSNYPILEQFDEKILSFKVGAWKPDPQIFEHALRVAQCTPDECFYIDDIPEFIEGARKAGLPGEVFIDVARLKQSLKNRLSL